MRRKLIVVSNRGPVRVARDGSVHRSSGGLATALRSLLQHQDVTWIASATTEGERALAGETLQQENYRLHLVAHDPQAYDWYYNVVANPMLWFVQHSLWELAYTPKVDAAFHRAWRDGYAAVNEAFARAVLAELEREPDAAEFDELGETEPVLAAEREIVAQRPEKLVVRVDRTDPSKNIVRGFGAFEIYLAAHPEMHRRVRMLALLDPSRQDVPEYAEYLGAIEREARGVNNRFQQQGWTPVELRIEDDFPRSVAAYKQFDVLLVNAIFDGMNLVAKEAPLVNTRDGVVVLSENTGAHAELGEWALTINPFDVEGQAEAIHQALTMDARERQRRLEAIRTHVRTHDVNEWLDLQLAALNRVATTARR